MQEHGLEEKLAQADRQARVLQKKGSGSRRYGREIPDVCQEVHEEVRGVEKERGGGESAAKFSTAVVGDELPEIRLRLKASQRSNAVCDIA